MSVVSLVSLVTGEGCVLPSNLVSLVCLIRLVSSDSSPSGFFFHIDEWKDSRAYDLTILQLESDLSDKTR